MTTANPKKRLRTLFALISAGVMAGLGLGGSHAGWAMEVNASGTYVDGTSHAGGTWQGHFLIGGPRLEGTVTLSGMPGVSTAQVLGTVSGKNVSFNFMQSAPEAGLFNAQISGTALSGNYTIGARTGTWTGSWELAPGHTVPEVEPDPTAFHIPHKPFVMGTAIAPPPDACAILADPGISSLASGAALRALHGACDGPTTSAAEPIVPKVGTWYARLARHVETLVDLLMPHVPSVKSALATAPTNAQVSELSETYPSITQTSSSVAAAATNDRILVAMYEDTNLGVGRDVGYATSSDEGQSWAQGTFVPSGYSRNVYGAPKVTSDQNGDFFAAFLGDDPNYPGLPQVYVALSQDNGSTWIQPREVTPDPVFMYDWPSLTVDRSPSSPWLGNVYTCFTQTSSGAYLSYMNIIFASSSNHGQSFLIQTLGPTSGSAFLTNCSVAVGTDGAVYVAWWDSQYNKMSLRKSVDGGATFSPAVDIGVTEADPPQGMCRDNGNWPTLTGNVRAVPRANLSTDPMTPDDVYLSWGSVTGTGHMAIMFSRSTNFGANWASPVQISDNVAPEDQFQPAMATTKVTINGQTESVVRVTWYDRRLDSSNYNFDIYETTSSDNGQTWSANARWTTATSVLPALDPNFDCRRPACILTDSAALAGLSAGSVFAGWTDSRNIVSGTPCGSGVSRDSNPNIVGGVGC